MLNKRPKHKIRGAVDKSVEQRKQEGIKSFLMLIFGAIAVAMLGVFFYLSPFFHQINPAVTSDDTSKPVEIPKSETSTQSYQFYEILPKQEFPSVAGSVSIAPPVVDTPVVVDTVVTDTASVPEAEPLDDDSNRIHIQSANTYILQIYSYDNADEADQKRAEVIMAGVDAEVVKRLDGDAPIYQVVSLPVDSRDEIMKAYRLLKASGIDSVVVEQKRQ